MNTSNTRWTIRNIYLYLVCFVCLILLIVSLSQLSSNIVGILYPPPMMIQPPEAYDPGGKMAAAERQKIQAIQEKAARDSQTYNYVRESIQEGVMILLVVPLYIYHWRKIQAESSREENG
ncbi:MAG: hypothetical protein ACM3PP_00005 [Candidatus Saccharibacteria bacterium]